MDEPQARPRGLVVHQALCTGCGSCAELCPAVFAMDPESGAAWVRESADLEDAALEEALACCPEDCIERET